MFLPSSFYDLSICQTDPNILGELCETSLQFGFRTIAVNQVIEEPIFPSKKNKKKKRDEQDIDNIESQMIPPPVPLDDLQKEYEGKLKILNRLTFPFSEAPQAHKILQSPNVRKYDILGVIPKTQAAYQLACSTLAIDIISFNPEVPLKIHRKAYKVAARRCIYFEIMYSPALFDDDIRQSVMLRAQQYHIFGKSKNVVLTSSASLPFQLRRPYDVMTVGVLFGLSEEEAKWAISKASRKVVNHGFVRRLGRIAPFLSVHSEMTPQIVKQVSNEKKDDDDLRTSKRRRQF